MKDSEFVELLNLYLDHEIKSADAARLEAEVQSNPGRRRIYQDYCRMQKACKMLAHDFGTETSEPSQKVVAFDSQSRGTGGRGWYVSGAVAVAACVALAIGARIHRSAVTPSGPAIVQSDSASTAAPKTGIVLAKSETPGVAPANQPVIATLSLQNNNTAPSLALDPHLAWMREVQLKPVKAPLPAEQFQLRLNGVNKADSRTFYSSDKGVPNDFQFTSIRFQR